VATVKKVATKVQVELDRFDGGRNTKDAPSRIEDNQSPDLLNVVFDDRGAVGTREGTSYFNTSVVEPGSNTIDGLTEYKGTMVAWAGGGMFRASGTTLVTVTAASDQFATGVAVAYEQYQDVLFMSDGTNGPYRWEGGQDFYNMGIGIPSAPTSLSDTAGDIAADTYFHAVSFINTAVVEGEVGSASTGVTIGGSATIRIDDIPIGTGLQGVDKRNVYRATAASGPWLFVKELADNVTTSFTDTVAVGSEGGNPPSDGTAPTPFTTIRQHRERLFFDDSANRTLLRYTNSGSPYISAALNFTALNKGDGSNITAVGVQQDLVTAFKTNSVWVADLVDPSDDTTWIYVKTPVTKGIVGPKAFAEIDNGIMYMGQENGRVTGFHYLSGVDLLDTNNRLIKTRNIAENIEADLLGLGTTLTADVAMYVFDNRIYIAAPQTSASTSNDAVWWFDLDRITTDGQPGSWSIWTGVVGAKDWTEHNGILYGGSSLADGYVLQFNNGTFTDADGTGIDSYMWTKEFGGEASLESWIKDMRFINVWYAQLGAYVMTVRWRKDGDTGSGFSTNLDLTPPGDTWNNFNWGNGTWSGGGSQTEREVSLGKLLGRRLQVRFENERSGGSPIAGQGFKVFNLKSLMNLRRQRGNV
jgi:hypothetical protein